MVSRYLGSFFKILFLVVLFFAFLVVIRISFKAGNVSAASLYYHPQFCAGGWENPQNGSGIVELGESEPESAYTTLNSAFLASAIASQIFCGYFPIEEKTEAPTEVSVRFHWMIKEIPVPAVNEPQLPVEETKIPEVAPVTEDEVIPKETTLPVDTTQPETKDATPTPSEGEPVVIQSILRMLATKVYAEEVNQAEDFLSVSYSLDGVRWVSLDNVSLSNWKDFSVKIPVSAWEDLKKIQIMMNVLPALSAKPDIYLDGMSLVIEYDRSIAETVGENVDMTANALVSLLDTTAESIVSIFTNEEKVTQAQVREPIVIRTKKFVFARNGQVLATTASLPWYSNDFREKVSGAGGGDGAPSISAGEEGKSFRLSGSCKEKYFAVLVFKEASDYIERPGSFFSNQANLCLGGEFSFDLKSLSTDIPDGSYYLLVASEDESNPWVPTSGLIPISISSVIEERIVGEPI